MSRSVISTTALMASGTLASRVLGFVRAALIAVVLGNGTRPAEAFNLANTIPNSLYILLAGGVMNAVLVPQIVRAMDEDDDGGEAYTNRIMTAFLAALAVLTVIVTAAAPWIMQVYTADGWRAPEMAPYWQNMVLLAYLCLPEVFFYGATVLVGQVLNSRQVYIPYMWAPIANNVISIAVFGLYLAVWGSSDGQPFSTDQVLLLGLGSTAGIAAQFFMLLPFLRRAGFHYRPRWDLRGVGLGHTFRLAQWTLYFVLVNQLAIFVVNRLGSTAVLSAGGSGAGITAYQTASLIWIVPHSLITLSLATQMMTSSSRLAAEGDLAGVARETADTMRNAMTVIVPSSIAFLALAFPIAQLMFGNGAGARDSEYIGRTLLVMAIGLVPYSLHYLVIRVFYALEDTRTPFLVQSTIVAANIVLAMALVLPFDAPGWVAAGLGGAYALAYVVGLSIAVPLLRRRLPELDLGSVASLVARLAVATAPGALLAWLLTRLASGQGQLLLLGSLVLAGGLAVGTFLLLARTLHIEEVGAVVAALSRRRGGTPVASTETSSTRQQEESVVADTTSEDTDPIVRSAPGGAAHDQRGRLLGGRFRLEEPLDPGGTGQWRATDLTLKRPVVCQFFPVEDERSPLLLAAAKRAAQVTDSRFVRILDFSEYGPDQYVIREFAPGLTLAELLADGPLTGIEAAWLVREVADAFASVHSQDSYHQRLDPEAVMMTDTGNVKILGFQIDEALLPGRTPGGVRVGEHTDVFDLGRLLYASLTGRWPGGPAHGLPEAPTRGAMWLSPRDVRPEVPAALDRITQQVLGGVSPLMANTTGRPAITSASELVAALSTVVGVTDASYRLEQRVRRHQGESALESTTVQEAVPAQVAPAPPTLFGPVVDEPMRVVPRQSPRRGWILALLVVVALAVVIGLIGVFINSARNADGPIFGERTPSPAQTVAAGPWDVVGATSFDPSADGGNDEESPQNVALAYDGDPETAWRTLQYRGDPELGGLKPGVGLVLDLGEARSVGTVTADVFGQGSTLEVRVPNDPAAAAPPMGTADSWRVVSTATDAGGTVELAADPAVETRYVLLYFTRLAPDGGDYRGGITEVTVGP